MKEKNSTFRGANSTWANACVGNNGSPSYFDYAQGFSKAANLLIEAVLRDRSVRLSTDEFVYPICFNMRHSVELRLKGAVTSLQGLAKTRTRHLDFDLKGAHDLGKIWSFFKEESTKLDDRFQIIIDSIDSIILDISEVDPTGQTFRYATNTESVKHLTDVALINLIVLFEKFGELEKGLNTLHKLYVWLEEEYSLPNPTCMQRNKIFELATQLPPQSEWSEASFDNTKQNMRTKYALSSNQLTKTIRFITNNHSLSSIIGTPKPLLGLNTETIAEFVAIWIADNEDLRSIHPDQDIAIVSAKDALLELLKKPSMDWDLLAQFETPEIVSGLHAIFYFAYDLKFSEQYEALHANYLRKMKTYADRGEHELRNELQHIFKKNNFLNHLLEALFFLGHAYFAESIIEKYGIEHAFAWLDDVREGKLFKYPDYAQYPEQIELIQIPAAVAADPKHPDSSS